MVITDIAKYAYSHDDILIVDDIAVNIELLAVILKKNGYRTRQATNGKSALRSVYEKLPALIILDISMPDIDGFEVCQILKSKPETAEIPIIFISAYNDVPTRIKALGIGGVDFISKPFYQDEVLARVKTHLNLSAIQNKLKRELEERKKIQNELQNALNKVEKSKLAALNLMEDLKLEIDVRLATENDLRKSEEKFRNIFLNIQDVYYETTIDGTILEISPSISTIGYHTRDELVGKKIAELHVDIKERRKLLSLLKKQGSITNQEVAFWGKNKEIIRCAITSKLIQDTGGIPLKIIGSIRNIEERKRLDEAKMETETKYAELLKNENNIVFSLDTNGVLITVNPAVIDILGYQPQEMKGKSFFDFLSNTKRNWRISKLQNYELQFKSKTNKLVSLELNTFVRKQLSGKKEIFGIARDVTERNKLIEDINRNLHIQRTINKLLEMSLEEMPLEHLLKKTLQLIIKTQWLAFEKAGSIIMFDDKKSVKMSAHIGLSKKQIRICEEKPSKSCLCSRVIQYKKPIYDENLIDEHNKSYKCMAHLGHYCTPIIYSNIVFGVINTYLNKEHVQTKTEIDFLNAVANTLSGIIARKNIEEALHNLLNDLESRVSMRTKELSQTENLYFTTINSINDWVYVVDNKFKIIFTNEAFKNIFEKNDFFYDLKGKDIRKIKHTTNAHILNNIKKVMQEAIEVVGETDLMLLNKNYYLKTSMSPIIEDGKVIRVVIVLHDLTDLKNIEQEIIKNLNREKELGLLKSQFVSTVSHEFRTPLAGIYTSVQLLKKFGGKWDHTKNEKIYKQIFDAIEHTKSMLDKVSLVNKEQGIAFLFNPVKVSLKNIVDSIVNENLVLYENSSRIDILWQLKSKFHYLDTDMLRHILGNIVSNALKYSPNKKNINMNIFESDSGEIEFTIEDFGIGIHKDDMPSLFEPFYRGVNVEGIPGTGFGMAIVKKYVHLHNGKISVTSVLNKGTKVKITLPCKYKK